MIKIIANITTVLAAIFGGVHVYFGRRNSILKDAELYNKLPTTSKARRRLLDYIDARVIDYIDTMTAHSRDWVGVVCGVIAGVGSIFLLLTWNSEIGLSSRGFPDWVANLYFIIAPLGCFIVAVSLKKCRRDSLGRPIRK